MENKVEAYIISVLLKATFALSAVIDTQPSECFPVAEFHTYQQVQTPPLGSPEGSHDPPTHLFSVPHRIEHCGLRLVRVGFTLWWNSVRFPTLTCPPPPLLTQASQSQSLHIARVSDEIARYRYLCVERRRKTRRQKLPDACKLQQN